MVTCESKQAPKVITRLSHSRLKIRWRIKIRITFLMITTAIKHPISFIAQIWLLFNCKWKSGVYLQASSLPRDPFRFLFSYCDHRFTLKTRREKEKSWNSICQNGQRVDEGFETFRQNFCLKAFESWPASVALDWKQFFTSTVKFRKPCYWRSAPKPEFWKNKIAGRDEFNFKTACCPLTGSKQSG